MATRRKNRPIDLADAQAKLDSIEQQQSAAEILQDRIGRIRGAAKSELLEAIAAKEKHRTLLTRIVTELEAELNTLTLRRLALLSKKRTALRNFDKAHSQHTQS